MRPVAPSCQVQPTDLRRFQPVSLVFQNPSGSAFRTTTSKEATWGDVGAAPLGTVRSEGVV